MLKPWILVNLFQICSHDYETTLFDKSFNPMSEKESHAQFEWLFQSFEMQEFFLTSILLMFWIMFYDQYSNFKRWYLKLHSSIYQYLQHLVIHHMLLFVNFKISIKKEMDERYIGKKRGPYVNWFVKDKWSLTYHCV